MIPHPLTTDLVRLRLDALRADVRRYRRPAGTRPWRPWARLAHRERERVTAPAPDAGLALGPRLCDPETSR